MMDRRPTERARDVATFLALLVLLAFAGFLLALTAMVLPQAFGLVAVIGGLLFFGAFHYLAWGWWMPAARVETDVEPAEDDERF